jgi:hypothetical protein
MLIGCWMFAHGSRNLRLFVLEEAGSPDTTNAVKSAYSQICDFKETTSVVYNGSDRDRTDDLFHAMEARRRRFVDGKGLMSRYSRPKRPNRRKMLPICYQNSNRAGTGWAVGDQPIFLCPLSAGSSRTTFYNHERMYPILEDNEETA